MIEEIDNLTEETSNYSFIDVFGYGLVTFIICVLFGLLGIGIIYNSFNLEKECVDFYKENGYVLKYCNKYEDKLLKLELKDVDVVE